MSAPASPHILAPIRSSSFSGIYARSRVGPSAATRYWRSGVEELAQPRAGDDGALDLRGALVDPHDAGVTDVALQAMVLVSAPTRSSSFVTLAPSGSLMPVRWDRAQCCQRLRAPCSSGKRLLKFATGSSGSHKQRRFRWPMISPRSPNGRQ